MVVGDFIIYYLIESRMKIWVEPINYSFDCIIGNFSNPSLGGRTRYLKVGSARRLGLGLA